MKEGPGISRFRGKSHSLSFAHNRLAILPPLQLVRHSLEVKDRQLKYCKVLTRHAWYKVSTLEVIQLYGAGGAFELEWYHTQVNLTEGIQTCRSI